MRVNNLIKVCICSLLLTALSCKTDSGDVFFKNHPQLETLKKAYDENPDVNTGSELLRSLMTAISSMQLEDGQMVPFLEYGYKIASEQNMTSRRGSFLVPLIKEDYDNPATADRIYDLIGIMEKLNKTSVATVLTQGLRQGFPNYEKLSELKAELPEGTPNVDAYVAELGAAIFDNPDNTGINRKASLSYVDACEAYALVYPKSEETPANLFKAAEVAKSLRTFPKSLSLYDWIIDNYPDFEKTPTSLFLKGFIINNNLGDVDKAREVYTQFTERYPDHELADDVEFLIQNLGKTDEEILQMIEQKRQENAEDPS